MSDAIFTDVSTKVLVLADNDGAGTANMVSGTVFISGGKLYIIGDSGAELVSSS